MCHLAHFLPYQGDIIKVLGVELGNVDSEITPNFVYLNDLTRVYIIGDSTN